MKIIRHISAPLFALALFLHGCTGTGNEPEDFPPEVEKSDACDLLTFGIDGDANDLESSIEFTIDQDNLTVTATYQVPEGCEAPSLMIPSFTTNGKRVLINGVVVQPDKAPVSFAKSLSLVVVAENGDRKTYTVNLALTKEPEEEKSDTCDLLSFGIDGEAIGLESSIGFTIDPDELTVTATYPGLVGEEDPLVMIPEFTTDGEKVLVNDEEVVSGESEMSFASEFVLVVVAENGDEKSYTVRLDYTRDEGGDKSDTCDLLSFGINGTLNGLKNTISFTFDEGSLTYSGSYLTWINGDNPETMVPTFTTNGHRVLVGGDEVVSGETGVSFADDVSFVVVAENGARKTYTVSLICPQINTELPVLRLRPDRSITNTSTYISTTLDMYSPSTDEGWWSESDGKIQVRGRGNSTWGLPKKPYKLKFPVKHSPIGLDHATAKDWVILAHDMDKSLLRNHIAFEFSRVLFDPDESYHDPKAIMFTPCSQHVNIYMGDNYHGIYQMSDQKERGDGRMSVDKLTAAEGDDSYLITGGYMLESDIHGDTPRFNSSHGIGFHYTYPENDDYHTSQYTYIRNFINTAEGVLYGSNFKDPVNGWRKYFDEKTMADYIIVKEFAGDFDGYTSTQIYKRRGVDKIFFGPIWDVDKGWDNDRRNSDRNPNSSLMIYAGFYMPSYVNPDWFHRVWQDETFRKFVGERWAARKAELTAAAMKALDEKPRQMAKSLKANFMVWDFYYQYSNEAKMPAGTYELEIERMRTLTDSRSALLDRLFK